MHHAEDRALATALAHLEHVYKDNVGRQSCCIKCWLGSVTKRCCSNRLQHRRCHTIGQLMVSPAPQHHLPE